MPKDDAEGHDAERPGMFLRKGIRRCRKDTELLALASEEGAFEYPFGFFLRRGKTAAQSTALLGRPHP